MSRLATGALGPPAVPAPSLDDLLNVDWFRYSILKPENARAIGLASQHLLSPPEETDDLDGGANCAGNCVFSEEKNEDYLGEEDEKSRQAKGRRNSGPLKPEKGGTGDALKDFETLTEGSYEPASDQYPEGSLQGDNKIVYRPPRGSSGARIDIPAREGRSHETLHY